MKQTKIYGGRVSDLILPDHIADWDVHEYWERERYDSMTEQLGLDDVLLIAGAEHGYLAALWSRLCGSTILVEPSPPFWRNIRMTWEANNLTPPLLVTQSFLSDIPDYDASYYTDGVWPRSAYPDEECPAQEYRYLFEEKHRNEISTTTIDHMAKHGAVPTAISLDVEGAEVKILPGAEELLRSSDVKCWISVHPDLIERDYSPSTADDVHQFMRGLGYGGQLLATDHEEHWFYRRQQ